MKDLFQNYHKHKMLSHLSIVGVSLVLALSINMFLFQSQPGSMLKANILEWTTPENSAQNSVDIVLKTEKNNIVLSSQNPMSEVVSINYSLAYNLSGITLQEITSSLEWVSIDEIENEAGYRNIVFLFDAPTNIWWNSELARLTFQKLSPEKTEYLNPVEINFTDSEGNTYLLSSEGIKL